MASLIIRWLFLLLLLLLPSFSFAEIDLVTNQTLYQVTQDSPDCQSLGLTGERGAEVLISPLGDNGIQIIGNGSLGDQTLSCSSIPSDDYIDSLGSSSELFYRRLSGMMDSQANKFFTYNCSVGDAIYQSSLLSSKVGVLLAINECFIGLNVTQALSFSGLEISGTISNPKNCSSVVIDGYFSATNFTYNENSEITSETMSFLAGKLTDSKNQFELENSVFICGFQYFGATLDLLGCNTIANGSAHYISSKEISLVPFAENGIILFVDGTESICGEVLGTVIKSIGVWGLIAAVVVWLINP